MLSSTEIVVVNELLETRLGAALGEELGISVLCPFPLFFPGAFPEFPGDGAEGF